MKYDPKKSMLAFTVACLLIAGAHIATVAVRKPATPEAAGAQFCEAVLADNDRKIKRLATDDLRSAWNDAVKKNNEIAKANPDEKPPPGDGVPVSAFPDAMPVCEVAKVMPKADGALVDIRHILPEDPKAGWTDRLVLKQEGAAWLIDDVLFPPSGRNGLRTALKAASSQ